MEDYALYRQIRTNRISTDLMDILPLSLYWCVPTENGMQITAKNSQAKGMSSAASGGCNLFVLLNLQPGGDRQRMCHP